MRRIGTVQTHRGTGTIKASHYIKGKAMAVWIESEEGERIAVISTNLVEANPPLEPGEFTAKCWGGNEALAQALLASGLFEETGRRVRTGYIVAPVWRIREDALEAHEA